MRVEEAQHDIRRAYVGGGPGVMISAMVWFATAVTLQGRSVGTAFTVLFFGGMLIYPLGTLVSRMIFRRAREVADNPLGMTALESTIAMIGGLFAAWLFLPKAPELVIPLAAVAVGTHYAVFKTVYGDRLFWLLGGLVTALGVHDILVAPVVGGIALSVAIVELIFGVILTVRSVRRDRTSASIETVPVRVR